MVFSSENLWVRRHPCPRTQRGDFRHFRASQRDLPDSSGNDYVLATLKARLQTLYRSINNAAARERISHDHRRSLTAASLWRLMTDRLKVCPIMLETHYCFFAAAGAEPPDAGFALLYSLMKSSVMSVA